MMEEVLTVGRQKRQKVQELSRLFAKYHLQGLPEEEYREMVTLERELRRNSSSPSPKPRLNERP